MPFTGGLPETGCGPGSMLANTAAIRERLPDLLKRLGVETLLDAPCGDFNWMAQTDLSGIDYIGGDFDPDHVAAARERNSANGCSPRSKQLIELDLNLDPIPPADLLLCRDFFQHIPTPCIFDVLESFSESSIQWLLATSHENSQNDELSRPGGFRPINLMASPFRLPQPAEYFDEPPGCRRILGLWNRDAISNVLSA